VPVGGSLTETSACPKVKKVKKPGKRRKPARLLSSGGFYSPFAIGVLPIHTDSRIVGGAFIDTAVNGGSETGPMTIQSQAMCF
jgi:hypothetical protein